MNKRLIELEVIDAALDSLRRALAKDVSLDIERDSVIKVVVTLTHGSKGVSLLASTTVFPTASTC
jgi:hypothetical protein